MRRTLVGICVLCLSFGIAWSADAPTPDLVALQPVGAACSAPQSVAPVEPYDDVNYVEEMGGVEIGGLTAAATADLPPCPFQSSCGYRACGNQFVHCFPGEGPCTQTDLGPACRLPNGKPVLLCPGQTIHVSDCPCAASCGSCSMHNIVVTCQ